jgi:poly-gamma-glutamate synthesis protein (capsule biosynthesis protein)
VRWWSVVTGAARLDADGVTLADVTRAASAGPLYVAAEDIALVRTLFGEAGGLMLVVRDDLPARLAAEPTAFALLPVERVTTAVQALALDGIDPVRGNGDLAVYPLVTRVVVEASSPTGERLTLAAALTEALALPDTPPVRLAFTGDIIPARCVYDAMRRAGDPAAPFRAVAERLSSADLTIGSLDAAISDKGTPVGCRETFSLLAPPDAVQGFRLAGFDAVTVATNHAKDCGVSACGDAAFLDTLAHLSAAGIAPFGGGRNAAEAHRPVVLTAGGVRFAFLGYDAIAAYYHAGPDAPGTAALDGETLAADIQAARALADVVIVLPHWGEEYTPNPTRRQQELARRAVEAGAALVVGNHPHVVQAAAPIGEGYAAYALGNFVFDQDWSVETTEGVVLEATFRGSRLAAIRFLPVRIQGRLTPMFLGDSEGRPILRRIQEAARRLGE